MTKIRDDLTPNSPFPTSTYVSYSAYIKEKYGQETVNQNQFMIEIKGITQNLKLLTPGSGYGGSRNVTWNGPELIIPEFSHNFEFPAELWLKAVLMPSILHRLNYLLIAEKMRIKINRTIGISSDNYIPEPVIEKMKLTPIEDDVGMITKKMVRMPNSDFAEPKHLSKNDFHSLNDGTPWAPIEEPSDVNRHTKIFPLELDYYHNFLIEKMKKMNVKQHDHADLIRKTYNSKKREPFPISEVDQASMKIEVLEITKDTYTIGPQQCDLLAAITVASSADVFNMERHEVLGDSYLKFAVSVFLLQKHPTWHEGFLTACKGKIVSNRNLLYQGIERNIGGMLNVHGFNPKGDWVPPLMSVPREVKVSSCEYGSNCRHYRL